MNINVALLPTGQVHQKCRAISLQLGYQGNRPHISLWSGTVEVADWSNLPPKLKRTLKGLAPINCSVKAVVAHDQYVGLVLDQTVELEKLRRKIWRIFEPIDGSNRAVTYTPHITLGWFANKTLAAQAVATINWHQSVFKVSVVGISQLDPHGTCKKVLYQHHLNQKEN